jgi:hypothetical protein
MDIDGGSEIKVKVNGKEVCSSKAEYIKSTSSTGLFTTVFAPIVTIMIMTECDTPWKLLKGDKIELEMYYDFDKHPT